MSSVSRSSQIVARTLAIFAGGCLLTGCRSQLPEQATEQSGASADGTVAASRAPAVKPSTLENFGTSKIATDPASHIAATNTAAANVSITSPGAGSSSSPSPSPSPSSPSPSPSPSFSSLSPAGAAGGGMHAGRFISLTSDEAKHLGLKTEVVEARDLALSLKLSGHIEADTGGEVDISSRISGRLTKIFVRPGEKITKGHLMAMIDSRDVAELEGEMLEAKSKLDIATAHAERERSVYEEQIARPQALLDARSKADHAKVKLDLAQSEFHRIEDLYKEKIAAGKDYQAARAHLAEAKLEMEQDKIALQREQHLYDDRVLMKKDYQLALAEETREKQHLKTLIKRLEFIGADKNLTAEVLKSGDMNGLARIVAPVDGVVNHYEFATGELIHPDDSIFKLTDLSTVVVTADLPEVDLQRVKIGDPVKIKVFSYPKEIFSGTLYFISQHVHAQSKSLPIRARLHNPGGRLKPNMSAEIDVASTSEHVLACPKSAVHRINGVLFVYVKKAGGFEERPVKLETSDSPYAEVLEGLESGEEVATQGSQTLSSMQ